MRLLNIATLKLEEFFDASIPEYVILSHTWGVQEVTLQDIETRNFKNKAGYVKIKGCCEEAAKNGYEYVWIDTCCIDKTSSSELSEAINSMFRWYKQACVCYAYLSDIADKTIGLLTTPSERSARLSPSRWFTRGWTLQELLAPNIVEFYAADWSEIGTKANLSNSISDITGIRVEVLRGAPLSSCRVAERMSWASSRSTTRSEDMAYSLLGIFDVNMPLLYGEGGVRAFVRLQEEIIRSTEDYTIFVWADDNPEASIGLFAHSVSAFKSIPYGFLELIDLSTLEQIDGGKATDLSCGSYEPPSITSRGLRMNLYGFTISENVLHLFLNCSVARYSQFGQDSMTRHELLVLRLRRRAAPNQDSFERVSSGAFAFLIGPATADSWNDLKSKDSKCELRTVYVARSGYSAYARSITIRTPNAFRLEVEPSIICATFPKDMDGWLVPGVFTSLGHVVVVLGVDQVYVLVSAGVTKVKPWCHAEHCSQSTNPQPSSILNK